MAKRGIRIKEGEDFSPATIKRVISALNQEKPITKKEACAMLNISYNTTRLNKIIEDFIEKEEFAKTRRAQLRGKPLDESDKKYIVESILSGISLTEISDVTFRSIPIIKKFLKDYNIPHKLTGHDYFNPVFLEDEEFSENYKDGDLVFSARYNCPAYIIKDLGNGNYRIWTLNDYSQYAVQPFYELGDLRALQKEFNIKVAELSSDEIKELIYEAMKKVKKQNDK